MSEKTNSSPVKKSITKSKNRIYHTQESDSSQFIGSSIDRIIFLQRTIGNNAIGRLSKSGILQAKLRIGQPGDVYEQEAAGYAAEKIVLDSLITTLPVQRSPQKGWPDAAKSGATSKRISPPPGGSWNKETVKIGSILRIPVAGLINGNKQEYLKEASYDFKDSDKNVTSESSLGKAIVLVPDPLTAETVDVLLYMHGFGIGYRQRAIARETKRKKGGKKVTEVKGMEAGTVRDVEVDRMEEQLENFIKASHRPMVAVLPQGAYMSQPGSKKQHIPSIPSFGRDFDSDIYLTEVFGKVSKLKGKKSGRVILAGHSGAGGTIAPMLDKGVDKGKEKGKHKLEIKDNTLIKKEGGLSLPSGLSEVVLFDAINSDTELEYIENWVKSNIKKDVQELKVKSEPDDQKAYLKSSMRFRAYHSNSEGYTAKYNTLRKDIKKAINNELKNAGLTLRSDIEEALRENYHDEPKGIDTSFVDTGHEKIMGTGKIEEALGALISPI